MGLVLQPRSTQSWAEEKEARDCDWSKYHCVVRAGVRKKKKLQKKATKHNKSLLSFSKSPRGSRQRERSPGRPLRAHPSVVLCALAPCASGDGSLCALAPRIHCVCDPGQLVSPITFLARSVHRIQSQHYYRSSCPPPAQSVASFISYPPFLGPAAKTPQAEFFTTQWRRDEVHVI